MQDTREKIAHDRVLHHQRDICHAGALAGAIQLRQNRAQGDRQVSPALPQCPRLEPFLLPFPQREWLTPEAAFGRPLFFITPTPSPRRAAATPATRRAVRPRPRSSFSPATPRTRARA